MEDFLYPRFISITTNHPSWRGLIDLTKHPSNWLVVDIGKEKDSAYVNSQTGKIHVHPKIYAQLCREYEELNEVRDYFKKVCDE